MVSNENSAFLAINWPSNIAKMVQYIRGEKSQNKLNRLLKLKSNQISAWESERRQIRAEIFFKIIRLAKNQNSHEIIYKFLGKKPVWLSETTLETNSGISLLLNEVFSNQDISKIAKQMNKSKITIDRWLAGETALSFEEFIILLELLSFRALDLLSYFIDFQQFPDLQPLWEKRVHHLKILRDPFNFMIIMLKELFPDLDLKGKHKNLDFIENLKEAKKNLESQGVNFDNSLLEGYENIDIRPDPLAYKALKLWCSEIATKQIEDENPKSVFSFNLFNVSEITKNKIEQLHRNYFRELRSLVRVDNNKPKHMMVANVQLVSLYSKE